MTLGMQYDDGNIFAKIIRGEAPCVKLYEDAKILSFMDVFPQSEGHCLVIHKQANATNLFDMSPEDFGLVAKSAQRIATAVKDALQPDGVRIVQFNGAPAGQTVFHLHIHIIPIYEGRALGAHSSGGPADSDQLESIAAKVRSAI